MSDTLALALVESMNARLWVWSPFRGDKDAPMGGESAPSGYGGLVLADDSTVGPTAPQSWYVELPYTLWGDYVGGSVERANCEAIREDYPEVVVTVRADFGSELLLVPSSSLLPDGMYERLVGLREYPLWDDEALSFLETRIAEEDWDSYAARDFTEALELELRADTADVDHMVEAGENDPGQALWVLYGRACEAAGLYPEAETATSCCMHLDKLAPVAAELLIEDWRRREQLAGQGELPL